MTTHPSPDPHLQPLVAHAFSALGGVLGSLDDSAWDVPSLCDGWAARHVIAHLTMAARYDAAAFGAELATDDFDFQRMSDRLAMRDGAAVPRSLLEDVRSEAMATFAQPGGGFAGSLSHVVIHGLDVTTPLGLPRPFDDDATALVLDALAMPTSNAFGVGIRGIELVATDLDWSAGSGTTTRATAAELVLRLAGRSVS